MKGKQGQLHVVLQGITRTQVKNMLKGVHTLKQVKDAPNLLIEIDLDNILALDTFFLRTFVDKIKPSNKALHEFYDDMNDEELIEYFISKSRKIEDYL